MDTPLKVSGVLGFLDDIGLFDYVQVLLTQQTGAPSGELDPTGSAEHCPRDPLAPRYTLDTGGAGKFAGPNGITYRLG